MVLLAQCRDNLAVQGTVAGGTLEVRCALELSACLEELLSAKWQVAFRADEALRVVVFVTRRHIISINRLSTGGADQTFLMGPVDPAKQMPLGVHVEAPRQRLRAL